jgi:hypothetical protein
VLGGLWKSSPEKIESPIYEQKSFERLFQTLHDPDKIYLFEEVNVRLKKPSTAR